MRPEDRTAEEEEIEKTNEVTERFQMPPIIHHWETNAYEEWIIVNSDETVTHEIEASGWPAATGSVNNRRRTFTAAESKARWPNLEAQIDNAVAELGHAKKPI